MESEGEIDSERERWREREASRGEREPKTRRIVIDYLFFKVT